MSEKTSPMTALQSLRIVSRGLARIEIGLPGFPPNLGFSDRLEGRPVTDRLADLKGGTANEPELWFNLRCHFQPLCR